MHVIDCLVLLFSCSLPFHVDPCICVYWLALLVSWLWFSSSDVKDVGYVIVSLSSQLLFMFADMLCRTMISPTTAKITFTELDELEYAPFSFPLNVISDVSS